MTKPNPNPKPAPAVEPPAPPQEQHVAMPISTLNEVMTILDELPFKQVARVVQKIHQTTVNITLTINPPAEA